MGPARLMQPQRSILAHAAYISTPRIERRASAAAGRILFRFHMAVRAAFPWPLHLLAVVGGRAFQSAPSPGALR